MACVRYAILLGGLRIPESGPNRYPMRIRNTGKNGKILRMLVRPGTNNNVLKIENAMKIAT
jgi:hypothetical protein